MKRTTLGFCAAAVICVAATSLFIQPGASLGLHHHIVVIKPTFTIAAYQRHGFYDYYRGNCSLKCLTVALNPKERNAITNYAGSSNALFIIRRLNAADIVTDQQVSQSPDLLGNYEKVIVLHNEYVTQSEFEAITHHYNVLYLYPNSLFALVSYNVANDTITLERGHGYLGVNNAFAWAPSMSTQDEYNTSCTDWKLQKAPNGSVLDCYPEHDILHDQRFWKELRD